MQLSRPEWGWMDGEFVPWDQCVLHVRTQAVMFGALVFEGIRAYWNEDKQELYVFRLHDHIRRLRNSMRIMRMVPNPDTDMVRVCVKLLRKNAFKGDAHLNPYGYSDHGKKSWWSLTDSLRDGLFVTAAERPPQAVVASGVNVCVSSWTRISDTSVPPRIKAVSNYQNSRLAMFEALSDGYDNAVLLNNRGTLSEGPGACVFVVRNGSVATPPITAGILESITRATLITLFREKFGVEVKEREIDRTELYLAEEMFYCGSGYEVMPILSVDRIALGDGAPGPVTRKIRDAYFAVARGHDEAHGDWRTAVYGSDPEELRE